MAAHTLDSYWPYDAGAGSSIAEDQWRAMAKFWLTSGPLRGELSNFDPSATGGRNVVIGAGRCWIDGQYGELSTPFTQPFTTNTSGNPRIDRVVLRNDFTGNKIVLDVLVGTPGASPVAPAVTQNTSIWEEAILDVTLVSGYSAISSSDWVDQRSFAQGRPAGGPLIAICKARLSGTQAIATATATAVSFPDADAFDTAAIHNPGGSPHSFFVPGGMAGGWRINPIVEWEAAVANYISMWVYVNGSQADWLYSNENAQAGRAKHMIGSAVVDVAVGDQIEVFVQHETGSTKNVSGATCTVEYLGPLA